NKIDLPAADPEQCKEELERVLGLEAARILSISAKTGLGVSELLDAVIERIPAPLGDPAAPLRALIFDSYYDQFRGVISSIRVLEGTLHHDTKIRMMRVGTNHELEEIGVRTPEMIKVEQLGPGEVGYVVASIRDVAGARSGETITEANRPASAPLEGYQDPKPMVFCGIYPIDGDDLGDLRDALDKLKLNDASITFEPEKSHALGFGFRCGFLGLLHMEIVRERLEREFNLGIIATAPSVVYRAFLTDGTEVLVDNPTDLPDPSRLNHVDEPILDVTVLTPVEFLGAVMDLGQSRRGEMTKMEYLSTERVELRYRIPLAEIVIDFFDALKSRTKGYASLDYEPAGYETSDVVRVDLLINHEPVDAFSTIVHRSNAEVYGRKMAERLKELIPRQMFDVPIQAAIGGRVVARQTVKARRKDVLAKCYGGDITRKRKLLEKQKEGKKRMKNLGRVEVPQEAFVAALKLEE
ncbi:MAG: GTP-binding protein LepA, partial [Acidimicrobiaceae bacterium]|nr:GTP-binding protein LepA [Acidimicrobiaceae bacterium]